MKKIITYAACRGCGAHLCPHWLKDGTCYACRHPDSVVVAIPTKRQNYVG